MKKSFFIKILFIVSYLLVSGCVDNTPPTISGIEDNYKVYGHQTLNLRVKAKDAEGDPLTITWVQTSGNSLWKTAPTGFDINVKIPADMGVDQTFEITATVSDGKEETTFSTTLALPAYRAQIVESLNEPCSEQVDGPCGEGIQNSDIVFEFPSIDRYGVFNASKFDRFEINMQSDSGAVLGFDDEFFDLNMHVSGEWLGVKDMFAFDEENGVLYVKEDRFAEFINLIKRSDYDRHNSVITLYIGGDDSLSHSMSIDIIFKYGYGTIKGALVDKAGKPYRGLEGESVFIQATTLGGSISSSVSRGAGSGYSAIIQADGTFEINNLPVGVYSVIFESNDGKSAMAVPVNIDLENPNGQVSMEVFDLNAPDTLSELNKAKKKSIETQSAPLQGDSIIIEKHYEYLDALNVKTLQNNNVNGIDLPLLGTLSVEGGAKGVWVSNSKTFNIPKEVTKIKVVYTLTSAETSAPYRSGNRLRYRNHDHWQAKITISNGGYGAWWGHGQAESPWNEGHIFSEKTTSIRDASEGEERSFTLFAKAINVQDGLLPTTIKVDVYNAEETLSIDTFALKAGLGTGKGGQNWHIGLASNSHKKWTTTIEYSPPEATLDNAECRLYGLGYSMPIEATIDDKGVGKAELEMGFLGATVPSVVTSANNTSTKVTWIKCRFTATDTKTGVVATMRREKIMSGREGISDPDLGLSLTPLTRYTTGLRYPFRDIGGDAWMRWETRQYLLKNPQLIYNDASREHGGCFVKDRLYAQYNTVKTYQNCSGGIGGIRDHKSHRTGLIVDVRYPGAKAVSTTDDLKDTLEQAATNPARAAEVADWVLTARAGIDKVTSDPEVSRVLVAEIPWLKNLLNTGKDEEGNLVTGLSKWETKSKKVGHAEPHANHMHIVLKVAKPVLAVEDDGSVRD